MARAARAPVAELFRRCRRLPSPRILFAAGLVTAVLLALAYSADIWPMPRELVAIELQKKEDIHNLYYAAATAKWSDLPRWYHGSWNYPDVPYFRPLASTLFLIEYKLYGSDFGAWNRVTWLMHALNAALLYLLAASLFRHHPRARVGLALVAVWFFASPGLSIGHADLLQGSSDYFAVGRVLSWWPAQNDAMSLTFALFCLWLLDLALCRPSPALTPQPPLPRTGEGEQTLTPDPLSQQQERKSNVPRRTTSSPSRVLGGRGRGLGASRVLLAGALAAMTLSIFSKEMGFITMPMSVALILYRRLGPMAAQRDAKGAARLGALFGGWGLALWEYRRIVVPNGWSPVMFRALILERGFLHWASPIYQPWRSGNHGAAGGAIAVTLLGALGLRLRWPLAITLAACAVAASLCSQYLDAEGAWMVWMMDYKLSFAALYLVALALFWRYRRSEPGVLAAALFFFVCIPILQYTGGKHYHYWPGAFLALADAAFIACLYHATRDLRAANLPWLLRRTPPAPAPAAPTEGA